MTAEYGPHTLSIQVSAMTVAMGLRTLRRADVGTAISTGFVDPHGVVAPVALNAPLLRSVQVAA